MRYLIIHKLELTSEVKQALSLSEIRKLLALKLADGKDSSHFIISVDDNYVSPHISGFKRYTKEEVPEAIDKVANGKSLDNKVILTSKVSAFSDPEGKRARLQGGFKITIPAGDTLSQDLIIAEDRYFTGMNIKAFNSNFGDHVSLEVVHPVYGPIDGFIDNWYVSDTMIDKELYPAKLPAGIIIRLTYSNTGAQEASVYANLYLHKV